MGRPRRHNHEEFLRLFDELGVVKEAARRMGMHEQTAHAILRQSRGHCRECPTPIPPSKTYCPDCLERKQTRERARAKEHLRLGLCVKCDDPIAWGRSRRYCDAHATALVDYMREHRRKRIVNTTGTTLEAEKVSRVRRDYGEGGVEAWTRDKGCCVLCDVSYADRAVYLHHLDQNRQNNVATNFVCLCYTCHRIVHGLIDHPKPALFLEWFHRHYPEEQLTQLTKQRQQPRRQRKTPTPAPDSQIPMAFAGS